MRMNQSLAYFASVLRRDFVNTCSRELQKSHLTPGLLYPVLYIGNHPSCSPKDIMQSLHIDWGQLQRSLDKLASDGWILKEKNPRDRRAYQLNLTAAGHQLFQKSHEMLAAWDEEKLSTLTEAERQQLFLLLGRILQAAPVPDSSSANY